MQHAAFVDLFVCISTDRPSLNMSFRKTFDFAKPSRHGVRLRCRFLLGRLWRPSSHCRSNVDWRRAIWPESSFSTAGAALGLDSEREHDRLYRATLLAVTHGLIVGRSRYGLVVALIEDPADPYSSLAVREGEQGVGHDGQRQGVLIP
jgi:hypothetical protein